MKEYRNRKVRNRPPIYRNIGGFFLCKALNLTNPTSVGQKMIFVIDWWNIDRGRAWMGHDHARISHLWGCLRYIFRYRLVLKNRSQTVNCLVLIRQIRRYVLLTRKSSKQHFLNASTCKGID